MSGESKFSGQLFRPYFFVLALVITAAMLTLYFALFYYAENNAYYSAEQFAGKVAQQSDMYINELDLLTEQINRQSGITGIFNALKTDTDPSNHFKTDVLNGIDLSSQLKNLIAGREKDVNIIIYNASGDIVSSREYALRKDCAQTAINRYKEMESLINEENEKELLFSSVNIWTGGSVNYITLVRALKNEYSDEICGIIEIRSRTYDFLESISADVDSDYVVSVCDRATGDKILPAGYERLGADSKRITYPMSSANWEISIDYGNPVNTAFIIQLVLSLLAVYIVIMFIVFKTTRVISIRVSEPLIRLTSHVHKINAPNAAVDIVDSEAIDEIRELEDSFTKMLERVNSLVLQEKKAYSLALQAQMNPHFLYNILAVISSVGEEGGCAAVTDMCSALSDMLRYITKYEAVTVPLKDEVEHTKNYLTLMKSRYEDYFSYTIDIDENLMSMPVPKLFIQPLAENSFKHGFKQKEPPWNISIKMSGAETAWELDICDNGTGITEERIKEVEEIIDDGLKRKNFDKTAGLGIANTIIRLKMTHNDKIDYSISSDNGMHIKILSGEERSISNVQSNDS